MTEKNYDAEIAPLLKKVGDLCAKHGLPFLAVVEYAGGKIGKTAFQNHPNDECIEMVMIRHCEKTAPNVDGYLIGLIRWAKKNNVDMTGSIFLKQWLKETP